MPHIDGRLVALGTKSVSHTTRVVLLTGGDVLMAHEDAPGEVDGSVSKPPELAKLRDVLAEGCPG